MRTVFGSGAAGDGNHGDVGEQPALQRTSTLIDRESCSESDRANNQTCLIAMPSYFFHRGRYLNGITYRVVRSTESVVLRLSRRIGSRSGRRGHAGASVCDRECFIQFEQFFVGKLSQVGQFGKFDSG